VANVGTKVIIGIPKANPPEWFVGCLSLAREQTLVICDDDTSIHQIWSERIKALGLEKSVLILSFSAGEPFKDWIRKNRSKKYTCLVDFELLGQLQTGLDIIEDVGIQDRSILVTSRYEESAIKQRCKRLGVRLIPKDVAGMVPIIFSDQNELNTSV
jgi:hypothetical protein